MKIIKSILFVLLMPWLATSPVQAEDIEKAVYHVDFADADRYSATLTSINNMLNEYENALSDYDVTIVFVGKGARFVTDAPQAGQDARLKERRTELKGRLQALNSTRNVKLAVCNNTLTGFGLSKDQLYEGVEIVPSGVVFLAQLQKAGAAYIKIQ
ncbi:DsrE family protein [Thiomicrorhabdus sp.]|uniref:DsrE family protein n=1 Tax=Thiomicrorhabdus sp. TaxID=2039724 RepID=UPI0029C683E8|nr:DsrE family protein [Thiomicrorhabdus sp.]